PKITVVPNASSKTTVVANLAKRRRLFTVPLTIISSFERDYRSIRKQITAGVHALVPAPPGRSKAFLKTRRVKLVTEPAGFVKRSAERICKNCIRCRPPSASDISLYKEG